MSAGSIGFVDGEAAERQRAKDELRRQQWLRIAMRGGWPELPRKDLVFGRHVVEHTPSGDKYRVHRGEVDAVHTPISAYFIREGGGVCFLEPA